MNDLASERAVLAGICRYGYEAYIDAADLITANTFTLDSNQYLWKILEFTLQDNPEIKIDIPTIFSSANSLGFSDFFKKKEEEGHLRAILNFPIEKENVRAMAVILKKLEVAREGKAALEKGVNQISEVTGKESIDEIISKAENPIIDWTTKLSSSSDGPELMGADIREYAAYLASNKRDVVGISSGYKAWDLAMGGGFRPGTVNVVGARPKVGKTLCANNVAMRVASGAYYNWPTINLGLGCPVLQLDTEMVKQDQQTRQLALASSICIDDIEKGIYADNPIKLRALSNAIDLSERLPYTFLSISGQPFEETVSVMRRWVTKTVGLKHGKANPCLIIFDYLKLMDSAALQSKSMAEFQVLGFMMTALHNFAVRYGVPILAFVQLNRDGINLEDASAVSQSDRIIWLCSNFFIYKKQTDEEIAEQVGNKILYNRKLVPIAARHSKDWDTNNYINMLSLGDIAKIVEGPCRFDLKKDKPKGSIIDETDGGLVL